MTQVNADIYNQVYRPKLSDLADSFFAGRKIKHDEQDRLRAIETEKKRIGFAANADARDANADSRATAENTRQQTVHDQALTDLAQKRKDQRKARINAMLGEEAETIASLPSEKRADYYMAHLIPGLMDEGFDTSDMPDYSDELIHGWRMNALTPEQRSEERGRVSKANAPPDATIKIDGKTGKYAPVNPQTGKHAITGEDVQAPPQIGYGQGETGPYMFSTPRTGANPTGQPIQGPQGVVTKPKIPLPTTVQADIRHNFNSLRVVKQIGMALEAVGSNPTSPVKGVVDKLPFGNQINDYFDKEGMPTRQLIGELSSLKMKDISGAVINAHEFPRLARWIPQIGDTKAQVKSKLKNFAAEIAHINQDIAGQYTEANGYREDPLVKGHGQSTEPKRPVAHATPKVTEKDIDAMDEVQLKAYLGVP